MYRCYRGAEEGVGTASEGFAYCKQHHRVPLSKPGRAGADQKTKFYARHQEDIHDKRQKERFLKGRTRSLII